MNRLSKLSELTSDLTFFQNGLDSITSDLPGGK